MVVQDTRVRRDAGVAPERRDATVVAAWVAGAVAGVVALAALLVLGPPLGRLLGPDGGAHFWPEVAWMARPEPTEHARYLLALLAPALLVVLTLVFARRPLPLSAPASDRIVTALEAVAVAGLAACFALQRAAVFHRPYGRTPHVVYFSIPTLILAAALALALATACRRAGLLARARSWTAESPARGAIAAALAVLAVAVTLLPAIATETSVLHTSDEFVYHVRFVYDETAAVLDGRSPLGDFAAQYGSLWPYLLALPLALFHGSLGVFTLELALLSGCALLALYALLRRVARSSLLALALFLPLLATSAFRLHDAEPGRFSLINYFGTMPLRYAGPFLLAWLLARHLDGAPGEQGRQLWPLFAAAGLAAIDNTSFGIPALGATVVALLCTQPLTRARVRLLARDLTLGLALALAAVTALVLMRTGGLPDPSLATRYARLFAVDGFGMSPLHPLVGISTVIFLTYVGAIGAGTVLALRGRDTLLGGLLLWSGVFGLGAGSYYVGRSIPEVLTNMLPAWALAVSLLTVAAMRALAARGGRRPRAVELACLFAFGLLVCSLAQTPSPVAQSRRIAAAGPRYLRQPETRSFVAATARPGESVVMLTELGHLAAYRAGVEDVTPYTGNESIQTQEQLDDALAALHDAGGHDVFLSTTALTPASMREALSARGLQLAATAPNAPLELWVTR